MDMAVDEELQDVGQHQQQQQHQQNNEEEQLRTAVSTANDLLISSLAAGDMPISDDTQLLDQIATYRASISRLSAHIGQHAPTADAAAQGGGRGSSSSPRTGRDQGRQAGQTAEEASNTLVPGLGQEGVDFTVGSADDLDPSEWQVPPHCIPIHANVTTFDWSKLSSVTSFDVVMMDPPWQLATANPTRGVALGYSQLTDHDIRNLPIPQLQRAGSFLFVWVINSKYQYTLDLFDSWGYTLVDEIVWVKMTVNRRLFKSHGYYLQHAKEVCMVARKNPTAQEQQQQQQQQPQQQPMQPQQQLPPPQQQRWQQHGQQQKQHEVASTSQQLPQPHGGGLQQQGLLRGVSSDIIFSERRGQSQKPEEIYELIESLVPHGKYLEIFARKNNLRNFWVSIGNEVTGTGLPEEDMQAFQQTSAIPGAVYGRGSGSSAGAAAAGGGGGGGAAAAAGSNAAAAGGGGGTRS